jgi:hypothetical protein
VATPLRSETDSSSISINTLRVYYSKVDSVVKEEVK